MWFQPIEWTEAACFVALQGCLTVSVGVMLFVPSALGKEDGWYKSCYLKNAAVYEQVAAASADTLPALEIEMGAHMIVWGICTMATLVGGGSAQILCILESVPMLALIVYFFRVNQKIFALTSLAFLLVSGYLGFLPSPMAPSIEWQAASIFVILQAVLSLMVGICFLAGKTEDIYKSQPLTQTWCSTREREILLGATLLGVAVAETGATLSNVASDFCLLASPGFLVTGIGHWISTGDKKNAMTSWVVMLVLLCLGIFPRVMQ